MKYIDFHTHYHPVAGAAENDGLLREMDKLGIARSLVLATPEHPRYTELGMTGFNEEVFAFVSKHPDRLVMAAYIEPRNVMEALDFLTSRCGLKWSRPESPFIVGWFHDLCKCDQYRIDNSVPYTVGEPTRYEYNTNTLLKGHGEKSVMLAATLTDLTIEEVMCIRYHMGAFVPKEEWNDYTGAIHRFDNVLWTHTADMMAAHIQEVDR